MKEPSQYLVRSMVRSLIAASGATVLLMSAAHAADATAPAADATAEAGGLDEIVVTASSGDKSRLRSSISVSQISTQAIQAFTPRSEAEVLRLIPGINAGPTAGPGGNANIGVRGIPVSTGGSEYVGIQEDGLPVVLFGDIQFGNNDYWIRFDQSVDRVEAVRGGSASTFASQAPGAVINYVSKTGDHQGGSVAITEQLSYRGTRLDFDYGDHLSDTVRFHVGGFLVDGNGPSNVGYSASRGYQIKGNITKDLDDGKGYVRLNFKRLDDQEPTNTSMPSLGNLDSAGNISSYSNIPGIDARRYSSNGIYNQQLQVLTTTGIEQVSNQGIHPVATALGGEFHYDFDRVSVDDRFRYTSMSGVFANQWTTEGLTSGVLGSTVNGGVVRSIVYGAGPNQGKLYTDPYINAGAAQAYVKMNDVGSIVNDLGFTTKFNWADSVTGTAKAGWFHMRQDIDMTWLINSGYFSLDSTHNPVPLDLFSGVNGTGTQLTANGLSGFNNQWGGCCGGRSYDLSYVDDAPYLDLDFKVGKLDINPSIRSDSVKASGITYAPVAGTNLTVRDALGSASLPTYVTSMTPNSVLDYRLRYTSWSLGALYELSNDTSLFARASRGGRFNADRMTYGVNYSADGSLTQQGKAVALNFLNQQEFGIKNRGSFGDVAYSVEATYFHATLTENNYDFTLLSKNPPQDPNISNRYKAQGVELTGTGNYGHFIVVADLTYTDSTLVNQDTQPHGMPKYSYRLSPAYDQGLFAAGLTIYGQGSNYANDSPTNSVKIPAFNMVSLFAKVRPMDHLELGLNVSNLFDKLTYSGAYIQQPVSSSLGVVDSSAFYGRAVSVSARYSF